MLKRVCSRNLINFTLQCCFTESSVGLDMTPIISRSSCRDYSLTSFSMARHFHTTVSSFKVKKGNKGKASAILHSVDNDYLRNATKEMCDVEKTLNEELAKHFTLQFDLRQYKELMVTLENGETTPLEKLGRVTLINPHLVSVNFTENPTVIKAAKLAIETSSLGVTPQQEGLSLFIPVLMMTRERREQMANTAKKILFNDYKLALNEVYIKSCKKADRDLKAEDERRKTQTALLALKKEKEKKGLEKIESAQAALLKEVA